MEPGSRRGRADSGYARNITFEKITLNGAQNPIIIVQFYCNRDQECKTQASVVSVDDVKYIDFEGTSAIKLDCDQNLGCHNIIDLSKNFIQKRVTVSH